MIRDPLGKVRALMSHHHQQGSSSRRSVTFQFLIVVECVFSVVSTPGENKKSLGLGPPGAVRDFLVTGAGARSERAAGHIVTNSSGNIVTLIMIKDIIIYRRVLSLLIITQK